MDLASWRKRCGGEDWHESLVHMQDERLVEQLRLCMTRGRPLGSGSFVSKLEHLLGKRLRPLPEGRKAAYAWLKKHLV